MLFKIAKDIVVKNVRFNPCVREVCYCKYLINRPDKTKITTRLLENAGKCRTETNFNFKTKLKKYV